MALPVEDGQLNRPGPVNSTASQVTVHGQLGQICGTCGGWIMPGAGHLCIVPQTLSTTAPVIVINR